MKHFLTLSITSFVFFTVLWVLWHFLDSHVIFLEGKGTLFYLPHAARVLCIIYFGYRAIPAIYLGELVGPIVLNPDLYSFSIFLPSFISVMSVPFALILLNTLGLTLGETRSSPLNRRNYKHIFLITFISAGFNALVVNLYMSRNNLSFPNAITDIELVLQFFIGDLLGTIIVFMFLAMLLIPLSRQARN